MVHFRSRRLERKLTHQQLAELVGCTRQMVGRVELGLKRPSIALAIKLGAALGVPAVELFPEMAAAINAVLAAVAATNGTAAAAGE